MEANNVPLLKKENLIVFLQFSEDPEIQKKAWKYSVSEIIRSNTPLLSLAELAEYINDTTQKLFSESVFAETENVEAEHIANLCLLIGYLRPKDQLKCNIQAFALADNLKVKKNFWERINCLENTPEDAENEIILALLTQSLADEFYLKEAEKRIALPQNSHNDYSGCLSLLFQLYDLKKIRQNYSELALRSNELQLLKTLVNHNKCEKTFLPLVKHLGYIHNHIPELSKLSEVLLLIALRNRSQTMIWTSNAITEVLAMVQNDNSDANFRFSALELVLQGLGENEQIGSIFAPTTKLLAQEIILHNCYFKGLYVIKKLTFNLCSDYEYLLLLQRLMEPLIQTQNSALCHLYFAHIEKLFSEHGQIFDSRGISNAFDIIALIWKNQKQDEATKLVKTLLSSNGKTKAFVEEVAHHPEFDQAVMEKLNWQKCKIDSMLLYSLRNNFGSSLCQELYRQAFEEIFARTDLDTETKKTGAQILLNDLKIDTLENLSSAFLKIIEEHKKHQETLALFK